MENNKQYWDKVGGKYKNNWINFAKSKLSEKEINCILKYFSNNLKKNILDIGPGNGRIIQAYLQQTNSNNEKAHITGIDISDSMVSVCQEKFKNYPNVKIEKCDISKEEIPVINKFDFISAIRVLKYNENWREIIKKISQSLEKNGTFVFTMINNNSTDRFAIYPIKIYKTNRKEIKSILKPNNLDMIEMTSFQKIPDFFYNTIGNSRHLACLLLSSEKILEFFLGKLFLGRILFIVCKKK